MRGSHGVGALEEESGGGAECPHDCAPPGDGDGGGVQVGGGRAGSGASGVSCSGDDEYGQGQCPQDHGHTEFRCEGCSAH